MTRMVKCRVLGHESPGLDYPPLPNELGQRIYNEVSAEGFKKWLAQSTMVINEYRLNPSEERAQKILLEQMEKFFFGEGVERPPDYVDPNAPQPESSEAASG